MTESHSMANLRVMAQAFREEPLSRFPAAAGSLEIAAAEIERLTRIANYVGGSPCPIPWDQLQQTYIEEIERLTTERDKYNVECGVLQAKVMELEQQLADLFLYHAECLRGHEERVDQLEKQLAAANDPCWPRDSPDVDGDL